MWCTFHLNRFKKLLGFVYILHLHNAMQNIEDCLVHLGNTQMQKMFDSVPGCHRFFFCNKCLILCLGVIDDYYYYFILCLGVIDDKKKMCLGVIDDVEGEDESTSAAETNHRPLGLERKYLSWNCGRIKAEK